MSGTMDNRPAVSVLGAGNWGSVVANLIAHNGHPVRLYCRRAEQAAEVNERHTNERYLPGLPLHPDIRATASLAEAVQGVPLLFFIVPTKAMRATCREAGELLTPDQFVVHGSKGFEAETHLRMSEIIREETCVKQLGVLSGPNIAPEIAQGKPAGAVVASPFPQVVSSASEVLVSPRFRVYHSRDVMGVEYAGALKNVVAIAAGVARQLELGENAKALLITRGMAEIRRIGAAFGAHPETFGGVAGLGDLIVTCASSISRNNRVGAALARGERLDDIVTSLGMVAEGINTARVAHEMVLSRQVDAPVFEAVYQVVHEGLEPRRALAELMALAPRDDVDP